jgi:hypothetical protein
MTSQCVARSSRWSRRLQSSRPHVGERFHIHDAGDIERPGQRAAPVRAGLLRCHHTGRNRPLSKSKPATEDMRTQSMSSRPCKGGQFIKTFVKKSSPETIVKAAVAPDTNSCSSFWAAGMRRNSSPKTAHAARKIAKGTALSGRSLSVAIAEPELTFASPGEYG